MSLRRTKKQIEALLRADDPAPAFAAIGRLPPRRILNPLFGLLYHGEAVVRWRAITAVGMVTAAMAEEDMAAARIYMRRLMWQLNDESGGIGWGAPEAMGEIMARSPALADEYADILISYLAPGGNFIEHEPLQRGVLWAVGCLGRHHPKRTKPAAELLPSYLTSQDPAVRGLAAWAAAPIDHSDLEPWLKNLIQDTNVFVLYWEDRLTTRSVAWAAEVALEWNVRDG